MTPGLWAHRSHDKSGARQTFLFLYYDNNISKEPQMALEE
jgi:hypothetical protein